MKTPQRRKLLALCLAPAVLAAGVLPCAAQVDIAVAKSNLWVDGTNTFVAYDTQSYFIVYGRITSPFLSFTNSTEIYIQDTSAAIKVWSVPGSFQLETNSQTYAIGREVRVMGYISQNNGMRSIRPDYYDGDPSNAVNRFRLTDDTIVPWAPLVTTISNYLANAEEMEGKLIRINDVNVTPDEWPYRADTTVTITDLTGSVDLFIDANTDVDGQLPPTNAFDLVCIAQQYSTAAIPSNGYEVMPRFYTDLVQNVSLEAPQLLVPTNVTAVVNVPLNVYVVGQDRNAADALMIGTNQAPTGSTLTVIAAREARFSWTPGAADQGTTNIATFWVTDGVTTNTKDTRIVVRPASGGPGYAWINEFHYDNSGVDTGEGVELAGEAGIDLGACYILLYNGSGGALYYSNMCSGVIDDEGHGYGAVWFPIAGLQNGSPDGIALVSTSNGLLQFLSYEGVFTAGSGAAGGEASIDVGVVEEGTTAVGLSLQLVGNGTNYEAFAWDGPRTASPGDLNGVDQILVGPVNAKVTYSDVALDPEAPETNEAFHITGVVTPNYSASNLSATAYYQLNGGGYSTIAMSDLGGGFYRTDTQVPGQTNGTMVDYYLLTTFEGPGPNSPMPSETNSYRIHVAATGAVIALINEVDPDQVGADSNEFVEVVALAGQNLENCFLVHYNGSDSGDGELWRFTFPFGEVDNDGATDTNGNPLGFVVIGTAGVANLDFVLPGSLQNGPDGLVLYDRNSNILDAVAWGGAGDMTTDDPGTVSESVLPFVSNYLHVTANDGGSGNSLQAPNNVAAARGIDWYAAGPTPGAINGAQTSGWIEIIYGGALTNFPPELAAIGNRSVLQGDTLMFEVTATEPDGGDLIQLSSSNRPANSDFYPTNGNGSAAGSFVFTPSAGQAGNVYTMQFYAVDKDGVDFEEILITVNASGGDCGVIFSEYVEGSSNNKAVEIFNGTASAIDLSTDQYYVMIYFNGSAAAGQSIPLSGTLNSGDTHVLVHSSAGATLLAYADQTSAGVLFNGNDAVVLRSGGTNGTVLDCIGQVGFNPGTEWGSGLTSTADNTIRRKSTVTTGDTVTDDAFDPSVEWDGYAQDTFDGLGTHSNGCPGGVEDQDGDGMSDGWEEGYFGGPTNADANTDSDGDGFSNLREYWANTIPVGAPGATNYPVVETITNLAARFVKFPSATGRVYTIQYTTQPIAGDSWLNLQSNVPGTGTGISYEDTNEVDKRLYRVRVEMP